LNIKNFNDNNEKCEKIKYLKHTDKEIDNTNTNTENIESPIKVNIVDIINKVPSKKPPLYSESDTQQDKSKIPYKNNKENYKQNSYSSQNTKQNNLHRELVFIVKPNIQNDIYNLYTLSHDNITEIFYDTAYIPNYNTSVMMNKLFRNIKENDNLDRLEESDDEDEFENDNIDKFVYLEKTYPMKCKYNYKFKKWYPDSLADKDTKIVTSAELQNR